MIGILLAVLLATWVALLLHELGHAATARVLGVRVWSITLGGGPALWAGAVGSCRVRVGVLPLKGEVRLEDGDAFRLGYQDLAGAPSRFEWVSGHSWKAALISAAGGLTNFTAAVLILAQWNVTRHPQSVADVLVLCVLLANALMVLNLMPIRGLDGWRLALHAAAWRRSRSLSRPS